jgi:hypothetical protein
MAYSNTSAVILNLPASGDLSEKLLELVDHEQLSSSSSSSK